LAAYRYCYRADTAQRKATARARRPKKRRLSDPRLWQVVTDLLRRDWSPQQIAAMLPRMYPDQPGMRASHETIYHTLFVQTRGQLRRELTAHLRTGRSRRKPRGGTGRRHGPILAPIPISARPASINDRAVPGHWEGDLLLGGTGQGAVLTLVERCSRYVLLAPLPDRHTADLARDQLTRLIGTLPATLRQSLTYDRGSEMAYHAEFSIATGVIVYFCDPHSPLATRHQREHQRPAAPVLAQRRRPTPPHPSRLRPHRPQAQHPATTHAGLADSNPSAPDHAYCNSRLSPQAECHTRSVDDG
jgi:IS30 family transposase